MKKICVFAGSRAGADPDYARVARAIGGMLARRGIGVVFGAGNVGLMGEVAQGALAEGGSVTGVIPKFLMEIETPHGDLSELIITETMTERKDRLYGESDGFIVLPGGLGSMEEMAEVISQKYLKLHDKPICIFNLKGYWDKYLAAMEHAAGAEFVRAAAGGGDTLAGLYRVADDMAGIEDFLAAFSE